MNDDVSLDKLLTVITDIKAVSDLPILVLVEQYTGTNKITAIHHGADEYQSIPENIAEAAASGLALIRRYEGQIQRKPRVYGTLCIDTVRRVVKRDNEELHLTAMEYKLLEYFSLNANILLTPNQIFDSLWSGGDYCNSSLSSRISRLRAKIEPDSRNSTYIITKYGQGYIFRSI